MKYRVNYNCNLEIVDKMPTNFTSVFEKFMNDLSKVIPELKNECEHLLNDLSENMTDLRNSVLDILTLDGADEKLAIRDEEYIKETFTLTSLDNTVFINIGEWWDDLGSKNQNKVWTYLNLMALVGNKERIADRSVPGHAGDDAVNDENFRNMLNDKLTEALKQAKENENSNPDLGGLIDNLKNSQLGKLAEEMAKEIDPAELGLPSEEEMKGKDPQEVLQSVLNPQNTSKLFSMIGKMGEKLNERIRNGDINQEELLSDAQNTMGSLLPGLGLSPEMMAQFGKKTQKKVNRVVQSRRGDGGRSNTARDRLRRKLAEKKNKKNKDNQ